MRKGIMLAQPFEEGRLAKWKSATIISQPKLDGERCRAVLDIEGNASLYSSENNIITSVPHINQQLRETGLRDIELDGELYVHGDNFEHIHSIVSRKVNQHYNSESMQFHIFDIVDTTIPQISRLQKLRELGKSVWFNFLSTYGHTLHIVPFELLTDTNSIMEQFRRYKDLGYEGIILRHPMTPYVRKRSPYMMKLKPKKNDVYKIVGYQEEISIHGTPKGRLGALILQGDDETKFSVGSGFDDNDRFILWKEREGLIGKWCEVTYQHITVKNKVPRFPIYVSIRSDLF